jgi:zinc protease
VKQYLPVIALGDVNALATEWMTDRNRVVVVQAPEKDSVVVPDRDQLLGVFAVVERKDIAPYEDVVAPDALVPVPPQPGTITGEQMFASTGVTEWRLSNGVRVLLRPTDFKDDEVLVRAFSPGGLSLVADADYTSGGFSPALVQLSGYGDFDATQLQKALAGKAVGVQATIDDLTEGLNGAASPKDLETLFQLIYLNFTALREDSVAFQSIIARFRAILENQEVSPEKAFADTLAVTLAQHHPRVKPVSLATLDDIDRDRAFDIFRDRFAGANEFTFVIVGTIDTATIRPLVLRWLGGLPTSSRTEKWVDNGVRPPEGVITKVVRKGIEPKSQTSIAFTGPFEYTRESVQLLNSLSDVLEIRLRDLIREELGGTYGVQVSPRAARDPWSQYSVTISFGAAPERLDSLVTVVFEEIARLSADGPDEATLQKVKETQRREHETNARQNSYWVGRIASAALQGYAADNLANVPALIDAVNAQGIAATARQLLRRDRYVRVSLMPER